MTVITSVPDCGSAAAILPHVITEDVITDLPLAELLICRTCRLGAQNDPQAPRPGADLLNRLAAADLPAGVTLRGVECLSNCSRGCTVALRGKGRWSYVYGDIDPALHLPALLEGAVKYHAAADGLIPWRERPEILRKGVIARLPPMED